MSTELSLSDSCLQLRALEKQIAARRQAVSKLRSQNRDAGAELARLGELLRELDRLLRGTDARRAA